MAEGLEGSYSPELGVSLQVARKASRSASRRIHRGSTDSDRSSNGCIFTNSLRNSIDDNSLLPTRTVWSPVAKQSCLFDQQKLTLLRLANPYDLLPDFRSS